MKLYKHRSKRHSHKKHFTILAKVIVAGIIGYEVGHLILDRFSHGLLFGATASVAHFVLELKALADV